MSQHYAALEWIFTVHCESAAMDRQVRRVFSPLAVDEDPAVKGAVYEILTPLGKSTRLILDGEILFQSSKPAAVYARLIWHVNVMAVDRSGAAVLLHAAAAEVDQRAVILCAPMESGKTTLVAGLVMAGAAYLTDEATALDPTTREIRPFPRSLSIDSGSWPILPSLDPQLSDEDARLTEEQWQVPPAAIRSGAVSSGATPALVILPKYIAGHPPTLTPVPAPDALMALLPQVFNLPRQAKRDLRVLRDLVTSVPCYRLQSGDLQGAVETVLDTLKGARARTP